DLVIFAINYYSGVGPSLAGGAAPAPQPAAAVAASALRLDVPETPRVGETFDVALRLESAGDGKAPSARLRLDAAGGEPAGVAGGALLDVQSGPAQVLSSAPGTVDAAVFGSDVTFAGSGELARVTFRVKSAGAPAIRLGTVLARDARNRPLELGRLAPV